MNAKLQRKLDSDEREIRLENWARWSNTGRINLGYPDWYDIWSAYLPSKTSGAAIAEADAMHLEDIITTLDMCGRYNADNFKWERLWAYVIKLDYLWIPRPVELRAKMVRQTFQRPCARSTYHHHVGNAKEAIFSLANNV